MRNYLLLRMVSGVLQNAAGTPNRTVFTATEAHLVDALATLNADPEGPFTTSFYGAVYVPIGRCV
jgi:hypothetical protein